MNIRSVQILLASAVAMISAPALAQEVDFVPPSDTTGHVWSTNSNDAYSGSRGVVFSPTSDYTLTSVGLYEDLTNVNLSYQLSLATNSTGQVDGGTVLASGNQTVTTSGLQWIDFALSPTLLSAGTYYYLSFAFDGNGNQNFFYNQQGAEPYSQPGFTGVDGTAYGNTSNYVIPGIRLNGDVGAVPEPSTWAMMLIGFGAAGFVLRRDRKQGRLATAS